MNVSTPSGLESLQHPIPFKLNPLQTFDYLLTISDHIFVKWYSIQHSRSYQGSSYHDKSLYVFSTLCNIVSLSSKAAG